MDYLTHNEIETEALGETLARRLGPGDVVAYRGDLGAGKTAFTRGLARGLGCTGRVTSPTFTVVNEYEGRLPLFHFDLYRLEGEDALYDIGWEDWSERAEAALPRETVWVSIRRCAESGDWRRITIEGRAGDEAAGP